MPKFQITWEIVDCYKITVEAKDEDAAWDKYYAQDYEEPDPHYSETCGQAELSEVEPTSACPISNPLETETRDV